MAFGHLLGEHYSRIYYSLHVRASSIVRMRQLTITVHTILRLMKRDPGPVSTFNNPLLNEAFVTEMLSTRTTTSWLPRR